MVAPLRLAGIAAGEAVAEEEELQLAQGAKLQAAAGREEPGRTGQHGVGSEGWGLAFPREVAADEVEAPLDEGVEEGRPVHGNHVQVGQADIDNSREQR